MYLAFTFVLPSLVQLFDFLRLLWPIVAFSWRIDISS